MDDTGKVEVVIIVCKKSQQTQVIMLTEGSCLCLCSVMSDSLRLQPARLLCPFLGKKAGVGCHFLLEIFPTQGSNMHLLYLLYLPVDSLPTIKASQIGPGRGSALAKTWCVVIAIIRWGPRTRPLALYSGDTRARGCLRVQWRANSSS